jgi:hypothetical protein
MAQATFTQRIWIAAPPTTVEAALAAYRDHSRIHPLIVAVRQIASQSAPDGGALDRYIITDRVPFGPLRLPATYLATIWRAADGALVSDAYQFPRVHLHNVTRCQPEGVGTRVDEDITIQAPGPLIRYVRRQALAAHRDLLANLKRFLETTPSVSP